MYFYFVFILIFFFIWHEKLSLSLEGIIIVWKEEKSDKNKLIYLFRYLTELALVIFYNEMPIKFLPSSMLIACDGKMIDKILSNSARSNFLSNFSQLIALNFSQLELFIKLKAAYRR